MEAHGKRAQAVTFIKVNQIIITAVEDILLIYLMVIIDRPFAELYIDKYETKKLSLFTLSRCRDEGQLRLGCLNTRLYRRILCGPRNFLIIHNPV